MEINLSGKSALVGGSSKGIGRAIAERLSASGANVTLMASNTSRLEEVIGQLDTTKGQKHQYLTVDFNNFVAFEEQMKSYF